MTYDAISSQALGVKVRESILEGLFRSGGGHYGGSLSVVDILLTLYSDIAQRNSRANSPICGDRVILSKGHAAIALYAVLKEMNLLRSDLANYGMFNAGLEGHPDMTCTPGVDFSTGSLGQGVAVGLGMAIAMRDSGAHVWVVVGDGECQEGQVWEAALLASRYRVSNLHVIVDLNGAQEMGWSHDLTLEQEPIPDISSKWNSFGWSVQTADGHCNESLSRSFACARACTDRPNAIIAVTRKGAGIPEMEDNPNAFHCATLQEHDHRRIMQDLNATKPR